MALPGRRCRPPRRPTAVTLLSTAERDSLQLGGTGTAWALRLTALGRISLHTPTRASSGVSVAPQARSCVIDACTTARPCSHGLVQPAYTATGRY